MSTEQHFIVHGMGRDDVGLVGKITAPIAEASGSILDLRQDVLHGVFTIYMVVDLSDSTLDRAGLEALMTNVGADTGLSMSVDGFEAVARHPDKESLLMVIIGKDRPGIYHSSFSASGPASRRCGSRKMKTDSYR